MTKTRSVSTAAAVAGVALALLAGAGSAQARDVNWSVGIGVPGVVVGASKATMPPPRCTWHRPHRSTTLPLHALCTTTLPRCTTHHPQRWFTAVMATATATTTTGTGTATVATGTVDQPPAAGLSPTSWARVAHRQRRTGCLLQRSFGAAFFLALHNPALWPASVAGALPRRLVCDRQ